MQLLREGLTGIGITRMEERKAPLLLELLPVSEAGTRNLLLVPPTYLSLDLLLSSCNWIPIIIKLYCRIVDLYL